MSFHPDTRRSNEPQASRETVLRDRWHEIADTADDAKELCFFALMLLEELGIARGLLLSCAPTPDRPSSFNTPFQFNSSRDPDQTWVALQEQWIDRLRIADTLPELRAAFEDLLAEYLAARSARIHIPDTRLAEQPSR